MLLFMFGYCSSMLNVFVCVVLVVGFVLILMLIGSVCVWIILSVCGSMLLVM